MLRHVPLNGVDGARSQVGMLLMLHNVFQRLLVDGYIIHQPKRVMIGVYSMIMNVTGRALWCAWTSGWTNLFIGFHRIVARSILVLCLEIANIPSMKFISEARRKNGSLKAVLKTKLCPMSFWKRTAASRDWCLIWTGLAWHLFSLGRLEHAPLITLSGTRLRREQVRRKWWPGWLLILSHFDCKIGLLAVEGPRCPSRPWPTFRLAAKKTVMMC